MFRNGDYSGQILDPFPMWNIYLRTGGSQNWSRYANPEFDAVLDKLALELDPFGRAELFNQGMDILDRESALLPHRFLRPLSRLEQGCQGHVDGYPAARALGAPRHRLAGQVVAIAFPLLNQT